MAAVLAGIPVALALAFGLFVSRFPPPATLARLAPADNPWIREARFWRPVCNGVQCGLCPFKCFLPEGGRGRCRVRMNVGGELKTLVYGKPVSVHVDPIEKKPVFHLEPGSWIYSLATAGCNLRCTGCQNWEISQAWPEQAPPKTLVPSGLELFPAPDGRVYGRMTQKELAFVSPEDLVRGALATRSRSLAFTYSEPVVFYEYMYDAAKLAREKGLRNVMVTGGYIEPGPLAKLAPLMDVVKVDLKGFDEGFYREFAGGELRFVLRTLERLKEYGVLTEVVNLVVPTLNDRPEDLRALSAWVRAKLGPDTPLFFSRFSPNYRLQNLPQTSGEALTRAREIARSEGLRYVYVGNAPGDPGEHTYCPKCGRVLVRRAGFAVLENLLAATGTAGPRPYPAAPAEGSTTAAGGRCPYDGTRIPGLWTPGAGNPSVIPGGVKKKSLPASGRNP